MKVLATYNIKGGVGKTATVVNLSYVCAMEGARTLVWDLDPQGAATFYFRVRPKVKGGGKALLREKRDLDSQVKGTDFDNLDLLPADFSYRNMDLVLDNQKKPTRRLERVLDQVRNDYDYVFLDCPPGITLASENVFHASDALLVPLIPTTLSARTLEQLGDFIEDRKDGDKRLRKLRLLPFFSMVDVRKRMHMEMLESLPNTSAGFLHTHIKALTDVERMGVHRQPVPAFAPSSPATTAYEELWQEVRTAVG
ncbi:MAG: ParA family protein [Chloroflexota bacterium]